MPRIALYAHDTYGLGHLRRCLKLAGHLATRIDDLQVLIVTGSPWHGLFAVPRGVSLVALPPVVKTGPGTYESRDASSDLDAVLRERQRIIAGSIEPFRPHLVLVDNVPCGLHGEVLPVLRALKPRGSRVVLMLRDVLDRPEIVQEEWQRARAGEALESLFDEIWIFGEAEDAATLARPHLLGLVADRLHICGRLPANGRSGRPDVALRRVSGSRPQVLVTGGGGGDAETADPDLFACPVGVPSGGCQPGGPRSRLSNRVRPSDTRRTPACITSCRTWSRSWGSGCRRGDGGVQHRLRDPRERPPGGARTAALPPGGAMAAGAQAPEDRSHRARRSGPADPGDPVESR